MAGTQDSVQSLALDEFPAASCLARTPLTTLRPDPEFFLGGDNQWKQRTEHAGG